MNYKKATVYFIGIVIVCIAAWDIFVMVNGGVETSISQTLITWGYEFPVSSFIMGFVMGHLYWKISKFKKEGK